MKNHENWTEVGHLDLNWRIYEYERETLNTRPRRSGVREVEI